MRSITSAPLAAIALAVSGLAAVPTAGAATATGVLAVSATVLSSCVVVATPLLFNNYTFGAIDTTATITVTCTPDVSTYSVGLDAGTGGGTTSTRKMTSGTNTLNYSLYRNGGRTMNWGNLDGVDAASYAMGTGTTVKQFTVYGTMPANQVAGVGVYLDTVNISVNY